jgi:hypothetical protein
MSSLAKANHQNNIGFFLILYAAKTAGSYFFKFIPNTLQHFYKEN